MPDRSINAPRALSRTFTQWVQYEGTDALLQGEGVCYNSDYGTPTEADARRFNHVERPTTTNNRNFAGVAARDYSAHASGQLIEINEPGSICQIAIGVDVVVGTGMITCSVGADAGRFTLAGFPGRGSAIPAQTNASGQIGGETDGTGSVATSGLTLTAGNAQFATAAAGDILVITAGEDDGTGKIVPGKYVISSVTSSTIVVLTETCVDTTPAGALLCSYYVMNGNPKCLARLLDGEESGLQEIVATPEDGGAAVMTYMVGGFTYINGGVTVATADANGALADGTMYGERKGFYCLGTLGTNDAKVTLATGGMQADGATALANIVFHAAAEIAILQWDGIWRELVISGATAA